MIRTGTLTLASCLVMTEGMKVDGELASVGLALSTQGEQSGVVSFAGSNYVKLHVSQLQLEEGDVLTVSDESERDVQVYTQEDVEEHGVWAMTTYADKVVVKVKQSAANAAAGKTATATISEAFHGVRDDVMPPSETNQRTAETLADIPDGCTVASKDIACEKNNHPTMYEKAKASARLSLGGGVCTAWRVGSKPDTMITNNHCIGSQSDANRAEAEFNFEPSSCRGGDARRRRITVRVNRMLMTDKDLDLTVFTIRNADRVSQFGSYELSTTTPRRGEGLYIAGHPAGRSKELHPNCKTSWVDSSIRNMVGFDCSPEGGSSGSPVISKESNKVVALLCHGYGRQCGGFGARSDLIYRKVRDLVGSGSTGPSPPSRTPQPQPSRTPQPPRGCSNECLWCDDGSYACRNPSKGCAFDDCGNSATPQPPVRTPRPPSNNNCRRSIPVWGNCHQRTRCCASGSRCQRKNRWYSQCVPGSVRTPSPPQDNRWWCDTFTSRGDYCYANGYDCCAPGLKCRGSGWGTCR